MLGKLLGKVVGAPIRVVALGVKAVEYGITKPVDLATDEDTELTAGNAVADFARSIEREIEETIDE